MTPGNRVCHRRATLGILRSHIFNWAIWPDFSEISIRERPVMQYRAIRPGNSVLVIAPLRPCRLSIRCQRWGYHLDSGRGSLVFTGDTTTNDAFWAVLNEIENLRYLIIETAFSDREINLARVSKHLCPSMLAEELAKMTRAAEIYISHLKPGQIELVMNEIAGCVGKRCPRLLQNNQTFEF